MFESEWKEVVKIPYGPCIIVRTGIDYAIRGELRLQSKRAKGEDLSSLLIDYRRELATQQLEPRVRIPAAASAPTPSKH
ncbi:unnamed protein product [Strongylus vulgaris]|uniref:Uncharacterized protein n=1 Tax=Strongylus vulgaris TaxID=40348 RepID=A0A3P7JC44_STRVU|nr:unnamed protein product [Strongylus vulgaris]